MVSPWLREEIYMQQIYYNQIYHTFLTPMCTFQAFTKEPPPQSLEDVWHLFHNQQAHQTLVSKICIKVGGVKTDTPDTPQ